MKTKNSRTFFQLFLFALILFILCFTFFYKRKGPHSSDANCPAYDRKAYTHWIDIDGDCQNTRHEILIETSSVPVTFTKEDNCMVATGRWFDPYTGNTYTLASDVDIDHLLPLAEAHESGAWAWPPEKKRDFANFRGDAKHLLAVDDRTNRTKGKKDPAEWLPPNPHFHKEYARNWVSIKIRWNLTADRAELAVLKQILDNEKVEFPKEREEVQCIE